MIRRLKTAQEGAVDLSRSVLNRLILLKNPKIEKLDFLVIGVKY